MSNDKIITLVTDFGNSFFVGILKGVILNINPNINIVDITHNISKFNIQEAKFIVENSYKYFPENSIHVIVVDPGVGSERKSLIIKTDKYYFIAPDNGILSFLSIAEIIKLYEIKIPYKNISNTFHGRDIFAPVAAKIATEYNIFDFAIPINYNETFTFSKFNKESKYEVVFIDDFGNIFLNLKKLDFFSIIKDNKWSLEFKKLKFTQIKKNYFSVKKGEFLLIINSFDYLEIALREGNAAKKLKAKIGDEFILKICG